ncbi:hypothetical protein BPTFM16_01564 [Altererythrobacter insulae]|nr:hypothetical protein BPTFM16_01564 [Altererythrobacter insulae]
MEPSRIVILNDRSVAAGGATALALLSAKLFCDAGFKVTYITGDDGSQATLPSDVELIALGGSPLLQKRKVAAVRDGLYNFAARDLVSQTVRKLDGPGLVYHLHGWAQILSPAVFSALRCVEDRLLIHAHDFFMSCPTGSYFNYQSRQVCNLTPLSAKCSTTDCDKRGPLHKPFRIARYVTRSRTFAGADSPALIAAIHPAMLSFLERADLSARQLRVVRNPANAYCSERVPAEDNDEIVFIGRVTQEKGIHLAIGAAAKAGRRLTVIGDGRERDRLSAEHPEVTWLGWLSHAKIAERIKSARALVMPTLVPEPFGLVAVEALQSGVPLVAFEHSFIASEASDLGCAFLAKSLDPNALSQALQLLDDYDAVKAASENAFRSAHTLTCTHTHWRDELLKLYRELLVSSQQARNVPEHRVISPTNEHVQA